MTILVSDPLWYVAGLFGGVGDVAIYFMFSEAEMTVPHLRLFFFLYAPHGRALLVTEVIEENPVTPDTM